MRPSLSDREMLSLAGLGLALFAVGAAGARQVNGDIQNDACVRGIVYEVTGHGDPVWSSGTDCLGICRHIAVAPRRAAACGFTSGNLFVAYDLFPQQGLNRAAIAELRPDGEIVRCFCGAPDIATRLIGPITLAFDGRGRLLVTSGWLTDAVLAFSDGGDRVEIFLDGAFQQVAVSGSGEVYTCGNLLAAQFIKRFDADGRLLHSIDFEVHEGVCHGVSISDRGKNWIRQDVMDERWLWAYNPDGELLHKTYLSGDHAGLPALDSEGRVYVARPMPAGITRVSFEGELLDPIDLNCGIIPRAVAVGDSGRLYVGGRAV